jgi:hypothetical protein
MKVWILLFLISLILTLGMSIVVVFFTLILLNGYMSLQAAMPAYITFNCMAWPFMVGIVTAVNYVILLLIKRKRPFWQIILFNAAIVTGCLTLFACLLYFT